MHKKFVTVVLLAALLISLGTNAEAIQENKIIQSVMFEEQKLTVICADTKDEKRDYTVTLGNTELHTEVSELYSQDIPLTMVCMVDLASKQSEKVFEKKLEILTQLSARMSGESNMVIVNACPQLIWSELLDTSEKRAEAIQSLSETEEPANLYGGIVDCLSRMTGDSTYHPYQCLVVLSDGEDEMPEGPTAQEALAAVEKTRYPVYTIALTNSEKGTENTKILGSFSRNSYGGLFLSNTGETNSEFETGDINGDQYGEIIWNSIRNMDIIHADLSGYKLDSNLSTIPLTVGYSVDSVSYQEVMEIPVKQIPTAPEETVESTAPESTEEPVPGEQNKNGLYIGVGAGILTVLAVAAVVIVKFSARKKQLQQRREEEEALPAEAENQAINIQPEPDQEKPDQEKPAAGVKYQIYIVSIPDGRNRLSFTIPEGQTISLGRTGKADMVLNANDRELSSCHFSLHVQNEFFCIRDEKSLNGTFLNGVRLVGSNWIKFANNDKIKAGSIEYRISIQ